MTRAEMQREVLRLNEELTAARGRIKEAQRHARTTGVKMPAHEYAAMWRRVYALESAIETARLQLAQAEESAAGQVVAILRSEYPAVFESIARRAGVEA